MSLRAAGSDVISNWLAIEVFASSPATCVLFENSHAFLAHGLGGGLTGTVIAAEGRIRLWGLLVLVLRRFRAGFHTRIISDKNVIGWPAGQAV